MKIFRLIRSLPESAEYNMALDKEILSRYLQDGVPVLRIYSWRAPRSPAAFLKTRKNGRIHAPACLTESAWSRGSPAAGAFSQP
jgi:hypothetical protein